MKRLAYLTLTSAMAVLIFAAIALAQSSPGSGSHQSIQGQKGMTRTSSDQVQNPDQYSLDQSTPDPAQSADQSSSDPAENQLTVYISNHAFDPAQLDVPPKTTVTWVNDDTEPHTATSDDGRLFDSGVLQPGQSYSVWFDGSGTVTYHCKIHPDMTGTLVVGGSASGGDSTPIPENTASDTTQQPTESTQTTGNSQTAEYNQTLQTP